MRPRITRLQMFMEIAEVVAKRGTCDRARVGAILVDNNNNIISIGYNGAPPGEPHCDDVGHLIYNNHCIRAIHAEENCIQKAALRPQGSYSLFVTHFPCIKCQAVICQVVKKLQLTLTIIYKNDYGEMGETLCFPPGLKLMSLEECKLGVSL